MCWMLIGLFMFGDPQEKPSWYLESIEWVAAAHSSESLLAVHARLKPGQEYDEQALSQAMVRIQQLPWIVSARFALRKGTQRGRYRLVITLQETSLFFVNTTGISMHRDSGDSNELFQGLAGFRYFLGRYALVYGSATPRQQGSAAQEPDGTSGRFGISHFNFLGRGIFLDGQWAFRESDRIVRPSAGQSQILEYEPTHAGYFEMGIPLARYQWIRTRAQIETSGTEVRLENIRLDQFQPLNDYRTDEQRRRATLFWEQTTVNDSWIPRRGKTIRGGFSLADGFSRERFVQSNLDRGKDWDTWSLFADMQLHLPITPRQSVFFALEAAYETTEETNSSQAVVDLTRKVGEIRTGLTFFHSKSRYGDFALGVEAVASGTDTKTRSKQLENLVLFSPLREYRAEAFIAFRNTWFVGRFAIRYIRLDQETRILKGGTRP